MGIHNPHDKLFKSAMTDLRVARDFFEHYLPASILASVDLNALKLCPNSYVDPTLQVSLSDVLYEIKISEKSAYLYLLCEHQSSIDELMPFRLWQYIVGIWSDHIKKSHKKKTNGDKKSSSLPLVIPLVFYHGPKPYTGARHIRSLIEAPTALIEQLFEPFHLIDTHDIADEALRKQKWAGIMTFVMKHIYLRDMGALLKPLIEMIQVIDSEPNTTEYIRTLLNYLLNTGDIPKPRIFIQTIAEGLSAPNKEGVMTMASRLIDEGAQQGRTQFLISLLEGKFGAIPAPYRQRIEQAPSEQLVSWGLKLSRTDKIEALFEETANTEMY